MKSNKGFTLVELLVAITIASIVAGSIGALLTTSLRMYGKETTEISMQQEVTQAFNIIEDYIQEAQYIELGSVTEKKTRYVLLGTIGETTDDEGNTVDGFSGVLIVSDNIVLENEFSGANPVKGSLYMKTYPSDSNPLGNVDTEVSSILGAADKNKYLLASNIQNFCIIPDNFASGEMDSDLAVKKGYSLWKDGSGDYYYNNHITLKVLLTAAMQTTGSVEKKTINESVTIRNDLSRDIIISGNTYKKYTKYSALSVDTTTVKMEKNLGYIETKGDEAGSFNILEIVPDYSCDYVQYSIGGKNGDCFEYDYVTYADPTFDRVTPTQFMNYINERYNQYETPYFYQNSGSAKSIIPVYDHSSKKWDIINNELLKLSVFEADIERVSGKDINPSQGIWNESSKKYIEPNYSALKSWEEQYTLSLTVSVPKDVTLEHVRNADMIIIAAPADSGFQTATSWYNSVKKTSRSGNTLAGGDVSFEVVKAIYDKVVANKASISCPSALDNSNDYPNLCGLFRMLYRVQNKDISGRDDEIYRWNPTANFNADVSYGAGRDAFSSVTKLEDVETILNILSEMKYNGNYIPPVGYEYLYAYDYTGAKYNSVYKNQLIYNNESNLMTFDASGNSGMRGLAIADRGATEKEHKTSGGAGGTSNRYGEIHFVGAALELNDYSSCAVGKTTEDTTFSNSSVFFPLRVETIEPKNEDDPPKRYIYLTEMEMISAQKNGLYLFGLLNYTDENLPSDEKITYEVKVNDNEALTYENRTREADYIPEGKVKDKEVKHTILYSYEIDDKAFKDIDLGKFDNNEFVLHTKINVGGKDATGDDTVHIIVRDLFDLD